MRDDIFAQVKERVTMQDAINYLRLGKPAEQKGNQIRWDCPRCGGERTLSVNLEKGYGCFSGSTDKHPRHKGDDCIALVAHVADIRHGEAARRLKDHYRDRFSSAARASSSTKPEAEKAEGKGRGESANALSPLESSHPVIELLGLQSEVLEAMDAGFDGERILIPLRRSNGEEVMTLRIATRADQVPLLLFSESAKPVEKPQPDDLRKLFRVV